MSFESTQIRIKVERGGKTFTLKACISSLKIIALVLLDAIHKISTGNYSAVKNNDLPYVEVFLNEHPKTELIKSVSTNQKSAEAIRMLTQYVKCIILINLTVIDY